MPEERHPKINNIYQQELKFIVVRLQKWATRSVLDHLCLEIVSQSDKDSE